MIRRLQLIEKYSRRLPLCRHQERVEKSMNSYKNTPSNVPNFIIDENEFMKKLHLERQVFV